MKLFKELIFCKSSANDLIISSLRFVFPLFIAFFFAKNITAQDTILLPTVSILDQKMDSYTNSINIERADSFVLANAYSKNLAEILQASAGIHIRSYGLGGVTMMAMRNGNSYQTAVLWNGFNLQDPLNGGLNLTLLPGFFVDKIEMHKGGETSLFGSGAMGGSVVLNSSSLLNHGFQVDAFSAVGSFGSLQSGIGLIYSNKKWASKIKYFHRQAQNDFPFVNLAAFGNPIDYQKSAAFSQDGILQQNVFLFKNQHKLTTDIWFLRAENQVPTTMSQSNLDNGSTLSNNFRSAISYSFFKSKFAFKFKSALLFNSLYYSDINSGINYLHESISHISEAEMELDINRKNKLLVGVNNSFDKGVSESLTPDAKRNRSSAFVSWKWMALQKLAFIANLRQEYSIQTITPITYSLRSNYQLTKIVKLFASHSKNYRLPTFNDLFWRDYFSQGNPDLKPEYGFSNEFGTEFEKHVNSWILAVKANYFLSKMNDLIQWMPMQGVWIPQNFEKVKTNGVELGANVDYKFNSKNHLRFQVDYSFLKSVLTESSADFLDNIGKQIIFIPKHKANTTLRFIHRKYYSEYQQNFTGLIFTSSDQSNFLPSFYIANLTLGRNFDFYKNIFSLNVKIFNIWNKTYQVMPGYAMPGRHYELNLKYQFNP